MTDTKDCSDCSSDKRISHLQQGRRLEYFTIGWNLEEAGVAVGAWWFACRIALVGIGVDSLLTILRNRLW